MISAVIALLLIGQAMSQAEMIEEGDDIGRSAFAMGVCDSMGYTVHDDAAGRWGDDFFERGASAGWSTETLRSAFDAGGRNEEADIDLTVPDRGVDNSAFVAGVTAQVEKVKARCHRLAREHSGLISRLDEGDRNADAQLAIMLGSLAR